MRKAKYIILILSLSLFSLVSTAKEQSEHKHSQKSCAMHENMEMNMQHMHNMMKKMKCMHDHKKKQDMMEDQMGMMMDHMDMMMSMMHNMHSDENNDSVNCGRDDKKHQHKK